MKNIIRFLTLTSLVAMIVSCKKEDTSKPPVETAPVINSFSPASGPVGTSVIVKGENFSTVTANNEVRFNGIVANVNSATASQLDVTVPASATTGKITVKVGTHTTSSTDNFTVTVTSSGFSQARAGGAATASGNKIFFGGGFDGNAIKTVDIYDAATGTWSTLQLSEARFNLSAASAGNKVAFGGGEVIQDPSAPLSATVDIFDVGTNTSTTAQLSEEKEYYGAAGAGNKIVFAGGQTRTGPTNSVDIYDVISNTWSTAQLSEAKNDFAIAGTGNKILFAGGTNYTTSDTGYFLKTVDIYDAATGTWSKSQLSEARGGIGVAAAGNKIVFAGGYTKSSFNNYDPIPSKTVDIYDVTTNSWSASQLTVATAYLTAASFGNTIVFVRVEIINGNLTFTGAADIYNVDTGSWTTGQLSEARSQFQGAGAANKIVFAGGWEDTNGYTKTVDIYDVQTGMWTHQ